MWLQIDRQGRVVRVPPEVVLLQHRIVQTTREAPRLDVLHPIRLDLKRVNLLIRILQVQDAAVDAVAVLVIVALVIVKHLLNVAHVFQLDVLGGRQPLDRRITQRLALREAVIAVHPSLPDHLISQ